ncbi:MAG: hypothetical protein IPK73_26080 [Candidatus Obscuribacter sp.]|jgi:hypothetical protein|nr:hypothetical protein [Candidatus Obscuribacter sp.]MBK9277594.1 hypothetical protein [Candidatus Obscuribacter sp.]
MSRFYFTPPTQTATGSKSVVMISPDHYGKSIACALLMVEQLKQELTDAKIDFVPAATETASIEIGCTEFDKNKMRVKLEISLAVSPEKAEQLLNAAGFSQGFPDCY